LSSVPLFVSELLTKTRGLKALRTDFLPTRSYKTPVTVLYELKNTQP